MAKAKTGRKKAKVSGTPKTVTIAGTRYTHKLCGPKSAMAKKAKAHRSKGKSKRARVIKSGTRYCLYTRG